MFCVAGWLIVLVDEVFSVDFYLPGERIAVEIDGHSHFNRTEEGGFEVTVNNEFKAKYLESIGVQTIHLGSIISASTNSPQISILRQFLQQYNSITQTQKV